MQSLIQEYIQNHAQNKPYLKRLIELLDPALTDNNEKIFLGPSLKDHKEFHDLFRYVQDFDFREEVVRCIGTIPLLHQDAFMCPYCNRDWAEIASKTETHFQDCAHGQHALYGLKVKCYYCGLRDPRQHWAKLVDYETRYQRHIQNEHYLCARNGHTKDNFTRTCVRCMKTFDEIEKAEQAGVKDNSYLFNASRYSSYGGGFSSGKTSPIITAYKMTKAQWAALFGKTP